MIVEHAYGYSIVYVFDVSVLFRKYTNEQKRKINFEVKKKKEVHYNFYLLSFIAEE